VYHIADGAAPQALVEKVGDAQEDELLTYLCDFTNTLKVMTTVKLLSGHAEDEHTLNEPNSMITVRELPDMSLALLN